MTITVSLSNTTHTFTTPLMGGFCGVDYEKVTMTITREDNHAIVVANSLIFLGKTNRFARFEVTFPVVPEIGQHHYIFEDVNGKKVADGRMLIID